MEYFSNVLGQLLFSIESVRAVVSDCCQLIDGYKLQGGRVLYSFFWKDFIPLYGTKKPDLILFDIAMLEADVLEMMKLLKKKPEYLDIPVIILASITEAECFKLCEYDFITKPIVKEVFLSRIRRVLEIIGHNRDLSMKLDEKTKELESISLASVNAMAALIDVKDTYTKGHSERVAHYSALIAENMCWSREDVKRLYEIALLHDVGKIWMPDKILLKETDLSDDEMEIMKTHTTIGADILKNITTLKDLELGARYHHERFDGKGYPEGLKGVEIPLVARIICVADSFDAMSSNRCYRTKLKSEKIQRELLKGRGRQFDPEVVDAFLKSWNNLSILE